jgi:mannose-6-phosphate isomerase-like protein (cupin superfamily)
MSAFAVVNLLEVENSAGDPDSGIEIRFGRKHLDSRDLGVSLVRYAANFRGPVAHSHREQEEAYVVVAGSGRMLLDGEVIELHQWDVVRVAPEVVRSFEAGSEGLEMIAVGGPKPPEGDGVRSTPEWPDSAS